MNNDEILIIQNYLRDIFDNEDISIRKDQDVPPTASFFIYSEAIGSLQKDDDPDEEDINEIYHKDPACNYLFQPLLFYKGFQALQAYRVANYWAREKLGFSMYIQSIVSEKFNVDIHPSAEIGKGIMIDHASGVVIGETARVGDYCSIFHGVTLGGVGAEKGQRHPQVGKNVLLSANSTIVGNIKIGDNTKIGAGSVVLNDIPKDCTAVGVPAKIINN